MNWYNRIIESKGWSIDRQRRMTEDPQQLYDYFHSDDPPIVKEDYIDQNMRDIDLAKPPIEMTPLERGGYLYPADNDIGKSDDKIDMVIDSIIDKGGIVNEGMVNNYFTEFLSLNLPFNYIENYIKKKYKLA